MLACAINYIALGLTGGGHGWVTPLSVSWVTVIMAPAAFLLLIDNLPRKNFVMIGCISMAILLDCWVTYSTTTEGMQYFDEGGAYSYLWVISWVSWQIVVAYAALMGVLNSF